MAISYVFPKFDKNVYFDGFSYSENSSLYIFFQI